MAGTHFKNWWIGLVEHGSHDDVSGIACICYHIWTGRNKLLFEAAPFTPIEVHACDFCWIFNKLFQKNHK